MPLDRERVRVVFDRASELDDDERGPFLDEACEDDAELRHEIDSMLAAAEKVSQLLGLRSARNLVGQRVQDYEVLALLGEGATGTVYRARHLSAPREAALEVLHRHLTRDPAVVQRFFDEARAADAIKHPNIVEVHDTGRLPDGTPYLLLEHLAGQNLRSRLEGGQKLPLDEALHIVAQAAAALAAVHERGIIHRDLKPENLFIVQPPDGPMQVKVLDFGIARLREGASGRDGRVQDRVVTGTARYLSPELCRGTGAVDRRSDVYSLGIILYEMLCGRPPFLSDGAGEVIFMHLGLSPTPPREYNPDIPPGIETAILKALAKRPEDRFASMRELRAALASSAAPVAHAQVAPGSSSGTSSSELRPPVPVTNRRARIAAALGGVVLAAGVVYGIGRAGRGGAEGEAATVRHPAAPVVAPALPAPDAGPVDTGAAESSEESAPR